MKNIRVQIKLDYNLDTWRSSVLTIVYFYDGALRSFAQTREDRLCRYMDLASQMYFRGVLCIYGWESNWYFEAYYFMVSYCVAYHEILHSLWLCILLVFGKYLIIGYLYLMNLILCVADIVSAFLCVCEGGGGFNWWILSLLLRCVLMIDQLLGWNDFMKLIVVEVRLGFKEYLYFIPLTCV